jgi:hypothetical protein
MRGQITHLKTKSHPLKIGGIPAGKLIIGNVVFMPFTLPSCCERRNCIMSPAIDFIDA